MKKAFGIGLQAFRYNVFSMQLSNLLHLCVNNKNIADALDN
jgi:hypothetical protein